MIAALVDASARTLTCVAPRTVAVSGMPAGTAVRGASWLARSVHITSDEASHRTVYASPLRSGLLAPKQNSALGADRSGPTVRGTANGSWFTRTQIDTSRIARNRPRMTATAPTDHRNARSW